MDSARGIFQFLSLEFFDNLRIELNTNVSYKESVSNFYNLKKFDFEVINKSNSSYFVKVWLIDEFMKVEKFDVQDKISANDTLNLDLDLGCEKSFKCGTCWVYLVFTNKDIEHYFSEDFEVKRSLMDSNPQTIQQLASSKKYIGDGIYLVKFKINLH